MTPRVIIGIDEVGRGPIAGPLCVGACLMDLTEAKSEFSVFFGIRDSKKLTPKAREAWFRLITSAARAGKCRWRTTFVGEKVIDRRGLSYALRRAIGSVLRKLNAHPRNSKVLLDGGIRAPKRFVHQETIIKGDEKEPLIASASIVAKVCRDRYMARVSKEYPQYGFEYHKGYGTKKHYAAVKRYGMSKIHRRSFLKNFVSR